MMKTAFSFKTEKYHSRFFPTAKFQESQTYLHLQCNTAKGNGKGLQMLFP